MHGKTTDLFLLKMILRGVFRHKRRNLKFLLVLVFSMCATIFSLAFQNAFRNRYLDLGIDARTAHITILPANSSWLKKTFIALTNEDLTLLSVTAELNAKINELPEVEIGARILEVGGAFYAMDGKAQSGGAVTGVPHAAYQRIFPGITLLEGSNEITPDPASKDVPFVRWGIQRFEAVKNIDRFVAEDIIVSGSALELFLKRLHSDFPLQCVSVSPVLVLNDRVLTCLNSIVFSDGLISQILVDQSLMIDLETENIIRLYAEVKVVKPADQRNWNKRIVRSLYQAELREVEESIALYKPMGLILANPHANKDAAPSLMPIHFAGFVEGIPEFYGYNFVDLEVLQKSLKLSMENCTSYLVRCKGMSDIPVVSAIIKSLLLERGLDYAVVDYRYLGNKTHMPIAMAIDIVFTLLNVLFLSVCFLFVSYNVMVSLLRRRREFGVQLVLGMSRLKCGIVYIGEVAFVVFVSWIFASAIMLVILENFTSHGMPGIVFFPKGILKFYLEFRYFGLALVLVAFSSIGATLISYAKLRKIEIVNLLIGESAGSEAQMSKNILSIFRNVNSSRALFLKIAIRNLFSNKRRNLIICVIFGSIISMLYLFLAFSDGAISNFRKGFQAINNPRGDIMATKRGFADELRRYPSSEALREMTLENANAIMDKLRQLDYVDSAMIKTNPVPLKLFAKDSTFAGLSFRGLDESIRSYIESRIDIVEGRSIARGAKNELLLNIANKDTLGVIVGDSVTVFGNDLFGHTVIEDFVLVGWYKPEIDNPFLAFVAFVDMKGYTAISGYRENEIFTINLAIDHGFSLQNAQKKLTDLSALNNWDAEFNAFENVYAQDDQKYGAVKFIIICISAMVIIFVMIGVINMILINLYDRRKEIGTYYCIGAEKSLLIKSYSAELTILNLFASVCGILLGISIQFIINSLNLTTTNPGMQFVFGGDQFRMDFNPASIAALFIMTGLISAVMSMLSLRNSLSVPPIAALRETKE